MATTKFDPRAFARNIRRAVLLGAIVIVVLWVGCASSIRVDAGHVGVAVKLAGSDRGVQDQPLTAGWHLYNPVTEQIILFPTSVQNVVWTQSPHEGRAVDESLTFSSIEGANVNADIGLSFHVDPALAPRLYNRFRQNDLSVLADTYIRNTVREAFNDIASKMEVTDIYGAGKSGMLKAVTDACREVLGKDGIQIDQLTINGALRLPPLIADAINRKLETNQNAEQAKQKVAQVEAEANQQITQAHGAAEAARQKAQGEADALLIRARAEAQANEIIRLSMTAAVLQYRGLEKWNGQLPTFQGGDKLPLLTFDVSKLDTGLSEAERQKRLKEMMGDNSQTSSAADAAAQKAQQQKPQQPQAPAPPPPPPPQQDAPR
jgi:regulator of protease activity HflC (stomatin/prohibitin superfamily)